MDIYHNAKCVKSKETLELLKNNGIEPNVIEYLKQTPRADELKSLLKKLGIKAEDLIRKKEAIYKEKFANKTYSESEWIDIMVMYPVLIERPIVVKGDKAVIGRPPENALALIKD
jgi:arsenate reductase (glutaredoxin)